VDEQVMALAEWMPLIMLPIALGVALGVLMASRLGRGQSAGALPPWATVLSLWLTCFSLKGAADRIQMVERAADPGE
jgi:hypothetical protein